MRRLKEAVKLGAAYIIGPGVALLTASLPPTNCSADWGGHPGVAIHDEPPPRGEIDLVPVIPGCLAAI